MKKISQEELKRLKGEGVTVKRAMGQQKKAKPKAKPNTKPGVKQNTKPEVKQHASMQASMNQSAAEAEALRVMVAHNTEMLRELRLSFEEMKPVPAANYTFDLERDSDKLLKRVYARVGIEGD